MKRLNVLALLFGLILPGLSWADEPIKGKLYKNPQCGCCQGHADYLSEKGFELEVIPTNDLQSLRRQLGVPKKLEGCHTILIGDYVVEGHVSAASIKRLLAERPDIKGISMPGMPAGSPGMGGTKTEPFTIYEISEGMPRVFAVE
uniref:DUF411 domain-containing protein n=1 Tax=Marinobacterium profundum TaxID=1714300 RepID=UPI000829C3F2|nr:DUF411 domain-containing protein [Marinobacterium profundum]